MDEKGVYVYVADQSDGKAVKIGVARDLKSRMKGLQCGNPQELKFHFTLLVPTRAEAEVIERRAHTVVRKYRLCGEWFSCDAYAAKAAVKKAAEPFAWKPGPASQFWRGVYIVEEDAA